MNACWTGWSRPSPSGSPSTVMTGPATADTGMAQHIEHRRVRLAGHRALGAVHGQPELGLHQDFLIHRPDPYPVAVLGPPYRPEPCAVGLRAGHAPGHWSWERYLLVAGFGCAQDSGHQGERLSPDFGDSRGGPRG